MNLENIKLREKRQTQKATRYMIPFTSSVQIGRSIETESLLLVSIGRDEKLLHNGWDSFLGDKMLWN